MQRHKKYERGFGLLELMLVIAFLSVLTLAILGAAASSRKKAQDNVVRNAARQMRWLAEEVYNTTGSYEEWTTHERIVERLNILIEEIESTQSGEPEYMIVDTQVHNFCISAPLVSVDRHYCVDASGSFVVTSQPCPDIGVDEGVLLCPSP